MPGTVNCWGPHLLGQGTGGDSAAVLSDLNQPQGWIGVSLIRSLAVLFILYMDSALTYEPSPDGQYGWNRCTFNLV